MCICHIWQDVTWTILHILWLVQNFPRCEKMHKINLSVRTISPMHKLLSSCVICCGFIVFHSEFFELCECIMDPALALMISTYFAILISNGRRKKLLQQYILYKRSYNLLRFSAGSFKARKNRSGPRQVCVSTLPDAGRKAKRTTCFLKRSTWMWYTNLQGFVVV